MDATSNISGEQKTQPTQFAQPVQPIQAQPEQVQAEQIQPEQAQAAQVQPVQSTQPAQATQTQPQPAQASAQTPAQDQSQAQATNSQVPPVYQQQAYTYETPTQMPYNQQTYTQQTYAQQTPYTKDHVAAGLLAIFLGSLGIHKFYMGYNTPGFIALAITVGGSFFTFGVAAAVMSIIGIVEGIIYLTKSQSEFEQMYVFNKKEWF